MVRASNICGLALVQGAIASQTLSRLDALLRKTNKQSKERSRKMSMVGEKNPLLKAITRDLEDDMERKSCHVDNKQLYIKYEDILRDSNSLLEVGVQDGELQDSTIHETDYDHVARYLEKHSKMGHPKEDSILLIAYTMWCPECKNILSNHVNPRLSRGHLTKISLMDRGIQTRRIDVEKNKIHRLHPEFSKGLQRLPAYFLLHPSMGKAINVVHLEDTNKPVHDFVSDIMEHYYADETPRVRQSHKRDVMALHRHRVLNRLHENIE